jgi:hypothetical protein
MGASHLEGWAIHLIGEWRAGKFASTSWQISLRSTSLCGGWRYGTERLVISCLSPNPKEQGHNRDSLNVCVGTKQAYLLPHQQLKVAQKTKAQQRLLVLRAKQADHNVLGLRMHVPLLQWAKKKHPAKR